MCYAASKLWNVCNYERRRYKELGLEKYPDWYYQKKISAVILNIRVSRINLTESGKSPASIALSNKQWVGTCLYQEWYKPLLISCKAATRL